MGLSDILALLCGVAFFLYGMTAMGNGLKRVAGNKLESYLWKLSSTPLKGFLLGTLVAAIIQSSSATSVMVVSFVNAGMMKFAQSICIILGANVGTTMTGWILTLSASNGTGVVGQLLSTATLIALLSLAGIICYMFSKKNTTKNVGLILLGLGTLLLSMRLIGDAVEPLKNSEEFRSIVIKFTNPVLGVLAGIVVAAIIQSSSASVGILQALCVTGALPYSLCLPVILGINIGASAPVLLSMIGGNKNSKRAAISYFFSNFFGLIVIYILYFPVKAIFGLPFLNNPATVVGIALMNTVLRVIIAIVLLPLHKIIEKTVMLIIPSNDNETADEKELDGLMDSLLNYPPAALAQAENAAIRMAVLSYQNVQRAMDLLDNYEPANFELVNEKEGLVDKYEDRLGNFVVKVSKNELSSGEQANVSELLGVISDLERISDHSVNIAETAKEIYDKKIVFSSEAQKELTQIISAAKEILHMTMTSFIRQIPEMAENVEPLEEVIDDLTKILRANHIERLQRNNCTIEMGFVFNDMLTNLERIADHCSNIAFCVGQNSNLDTEVHQYTESIATSEFFKVKYAEYRKTYIAPIE